MLEKWNWSFVDRVVYINLKKRPDRDAEVRAALSRAAIPEEKIIRFEAIEMPYATLACAKSHKAVVEMAKRNQWRNILVIEDDMVFHCDNDTIARTNLFFEKLSRIEWDVAFLAASYYIVKALDNTLLRVKFAYLANSYLVNEHYYEKLIANYTETINGIEAGTYEYGIDSNWLKLMETDNWYGIYPCIGYQRSGKSDILHRAINREEDFTRTLDEMRQYGSS